MVGVGRTVDCYPFHDVDILREHDDRLEAAFDESRFDERAAEV